MLLPLQLCLCVLLSITELSHPAGEEYCSRSPITELSHPAGEEYRLQGLMSLQQCGQALEWDQDAVGGGGGPPSPEGTLGNK